MTALVFMDTETTGLALTDDIWEFAAIRREEDGTESSLHLFIEHDWAKCRNLPESFRADHLARFPRHDQATNKHDAAWAIYDFISKGQGQAPHVVGAVPNFDTERLMRMFDIVIDQTKAPWHYHLIDVENLAVGYLAAKGTTVPRPWNSDDISRLVGIEPPTDARHTAMGDTEWARDLYDAVMDGAR